MDINKISNRTILRILGLITLFVATIWLAFMLQRQIMWVIIALFFTVALNPLVVHLQKVMPRRSRGTAAGVVVFGTAALMLVLFATFVPSLIQQSTDFVSNVPGAISDLTTSSTPVAEVLRRYHAAEYIQNNQDKIVNSLSGLGQPVFNAARSMLGSLIAVLTVMSLTFFMLAEGADWLTALRKSRLGKQFKEIEPVTTDMYAAVTGYVLGNLSTSILAGVVSGVVMLILGIPYAIPLAIIVALFDLLPLVGATIGATIVVFISLFRSVTAAIVMLIFFLIYQQLENQFLQPAIYSKTVQISPLIVFVAAIIGASLAGIIGALIAIPAAASIKIIITYYLDKKPVSKSN